ncbi:MAG: type I methionyl aminopeptidase [Candidatus Brocadiia bacterium]
MAQVNRKKPPELAKMRKAGRLVAETLQLAVEAAEPGVTTGKLDRLAEEYIRSHDAIPAFKGYRGYPATLCTSLNEEVVHGIPGARTIKEGDVLSIDAGVFLDGYAGDAARTVLIGECSEEAQSITKTCREALQAALEVIRAGVKIAEIGHAIQQTAEDAGYGVVRKYTGHGIGKKMHEFPQIPNFVSSWPLSSGPKLPEGATVAIEPMLTAGSGKVEELDNGWTVVTKERCLAVHFENTIAVEKERAVIMTIE